MLTDSEKFWLFSASSLGAGLFFGMMLQSYAALWPIPLALSVFSILMRFGLRVGYWTCIAAMFFGVFLALHAEDIAPELKGLQPWALQERTRMREELGIDDEAVFASLAFGKEVKSRIAERITHGVDNDELRNLARSMLLAEREKMSYEDKQVFVNAGTLHAFAVSGLHVGVVALVIRIMLLMLFIPHRLSAALTIPFLWIYVYLVGMSASSTRAGVMATILLLASVFFRRYNFLTAWGFAFWFFHVLEPSRILEVGSALSFSVTLVIVVWLKFFEKEARNFWFSTVMLDIVIWAAGVPIMAHVFGRFTPGGLVANLFVVPLAAFVIAALVVSLFIGILCPWAAVHLNNFAALGLKGMLELSRFISSIPGMTVEVYKWDYLTCALWYSALALFIALLKSISKHKYGIIHV